MPNDFRLLSVIIPVFNERSTVSELIDRILKVDIPIEMEIIVVDDGSNDGTLEILKTHVAIKHLYLSPVNIGKGAAIRERTASRSSPRLPPGSGKLA